MMCPRGMSLDLHASEEHVRRGIAAVGRIKLARQSVATYEHAHSSAEVAGSRGVVQITEAHFLHPEGLMRQRVAEQEQLVLLGTLHAPEKGVCLRGGE